MSDDLNTDDQQPELTSIPEATVPEENVDDSILKADMRAAGFVLSEGIRIIHSDFQAVRDFFHFYGINLSGEEFHKYPDIKGAVADTVVPLVDEVAVQASAQAAADAEIEATRLAEEEARLKAVTEQEVAEEAERQAVRDAEAAEAQRLADEEAAAANAADNQTKPVVTEEDAESEEVADPEGDASAPEGNEA